MMRSATASLTIWKRPNARFAANRSYQSGRSGCRRKERDDHPGSPASRSPRPVGPQHLQGYTHRKLPVWVRPSMTNIPARKLRNASENSLRRSAWPEKGELSIQLFGELAALINLTNAKHPRSVERGANYAGCGGKICSRTYVEAVEKARLRLVAGNAAFVSHPIRPGGAC